MTGWRKRVGIEPTSPSVNSGSDGFEGRAGHQTRLASSGCSDQSRSDTQQTTLATPMQLRVVSLVAPSGSGGGGTGGSASNAGRRESLVARHSRTLDGLESWSVLQDRGQGGGQIGESERLCEAGREPGGLRGDHGRVLDVATRRDGSK